MKHRRIRYGGPRQQPKKQTQLDTPVEIISLSLDGRGVARPEGKTLFVRGALPGERVEVEIEKSSKRFDEALAREIFTTSDARISPPCPYYEQCGGCDLQHLQADEAIQLKQQELLTQLAKRAQVEPETIDEPLSGSAKLGYRRVARVGINQRDNGELLMGFRRRASNKLVDIDLCAVLTNKINAFLADLRAALIEFERVKHLTQIEVIEGDQGLEVELRSTRNLSDELRAALERLAKRHQANLSIRVKESPAGLIHANPAATRLSIDGSIQLNFTASDFVQVNAQVNQLMIDRVVDWLAPRSQDRVLDLFSGLGNFSLPLAKRVAQVTAVEGSSTMVQRCLDNAEANELTNLRAYAADLSEPAKDAPWFIDQYDLILLDPPRQGAAEVIAALEQHKPRALVYIACDPSSLVRDAATLKRQGYKLSRLCIADMFPQTHHIESLALFERA